MARKRYQSGCLFKEGTREERWKLRYVEYAIRDGREVRINKKVEVGLVRDYPTRRLALRAAEPILEGINANSRRPRHIITFGQIADKWTSMIMSGHKPSSQHAEMACVRKLKPAFGAVQISEINREMIQRWMSEQDLAPKYIKNIIGVFSLIWDEAQNWGYIDEDRRSPFEKLKKPKTELVEVPTFTPEQAREVIRKSPEPLKSMCWIAVQTGMRGGELCGLFVEDVDVERQIIHIRRSAHRGVLQTPKTSNAIRNVRISAQLANHLMRFTEARKGSALLFCQKDGTAFKNDNVVRWRLKPILKEMGIDVPRLGFHAFRHCNVSAMGSMGTPSKVLQERVGHGNYQTSMGYMHSNSEDHRLVAARLGEMFDPGEKNDEAGTIRGSGKTIFRIEETAGGGSQEDVQAGPSNKQEEMSPVNPVQKMDETVPDMAAD